jgi:hypothetical protein
MNDELDYVKKGALWFVEYLQGLERANTEAVQEAYENAKRDWQLECNRRVNERLSRLEDSGQNRKRFEERIWLFTEEKLRPKCVPSANNSTCLFVQLPRRNRERSRRPEPPRIARLLAQAEEWFSLLRSGAVRTRAELANQVGVSAVRVSQVLALLGLHPSILDAIRALPPGTPSRRLTERQLRPLTRLPQDQQLTAIEHLAPWLLKGLAQDVA